MNAIFSRATVIDLLEQYISGSLDGYQRYAKRPYDHMNGTAQVPKGNADAMYYYGRIMALTAILEAVKS